MTRFNKKANSTTKTVNRAGGQAYVESDKLKLASMVLTTFLKDQFYRSADETVDEIKELILKIDPIFVAKVALYARNEYGMRSVSHLLAGEIGNKIKGEKWTKNFFASIVRRPDDILEILAYTMNEYGKHIPKAMKRGFAVALAEMNEYNLAKYKGEGNDVNMVDAVNLCHPKSTAALKKLMLGKLKPAETWEVLLTQAGQKAKDETEKAKLKAKVWGELLSEDKLGYFALLRNINNIMEQAPKMEKQLCAALVNEDAIKKSLVLPFRFATALRNIGDNRNVVSAIDEAVNISLQNVPKFEGKTLVALDCSGSMASGSSSPSPIEIGSLFAAVLFKNNDADVICFGDHVTAPVDDKEFNHLDSLLTIAGKLNCAEHGGTDFNLIFDSVGRKYDRIIILSDMQAWIGKNFGYNVPDAAFRNYKVRTGADPAIFSFDLSGYGSLQFPEKKVFCLAGFSDKTMDIMGMLEKDKNALVNEIEKIEL